MRIIGFNLVRILVERKEKLEEKLKITQNIDIKEIEKEKIPITKEEVLRVKFNFTINYSEDFAKLEFEGHIILLPEKEEMKDFLKTWKDKKVPEQARIPLFNFILGKCNVKALALEDEMALPLHIPMPKITPKEEE